MRVETNFVLSQLISLEAEKQTILDNNSALAEDNLTKEPELAELRNRINELSTEGKELCSKVQDLLTQSSKSHTNRRNVLLL